MRSLVLSRFILACCWLLAASIHPARAGEPTGESSIRPVTSSEANTAPTTPVGAKASASSLTTSDSIIAQPQHPPSRPPVFPRPGIGAHAFSRPLVQPAVTNQTRQALDFYGGYAARTTLSQLPRRTPIQAGAVQPMYRQIKPFHAVYNEPTVSPYLNLYRDESDSESAPTYYAFVRPQLEQIEANRMQQREIQKLRGQTQQVAAQPRRSQSQQASAPSGRVPARYMDTAQFYSGWRR